MMLWKRLAYLMPGRRRAAELDMQEELRSIAAMAQPGELGNLTVIAEDARAQWGWTRVDALALDLRYAVRTLWKHRGFSAAAILSLALGIGANTALFSLVDGLLLRPLPVADPERLVTVARVGVQVKKPLPMEGDRVEALARLTPVFDGVAAVASLGRPLITIDGEPEPSRSAMQATGNLFRVLGIDAVIGRAETTSPAIILSDRYWRTRFHADPAAIGKSIAIDGVAYRIMGVAPPRFGGLSLDGSVEIWLLAPPRPLVASGATARLQPGVSIAQARAAADGLLEQLDRERPLPLFNGVPLTPQTVVEPAGHGSSLLREQYEKPLMALMALVALVLLMTCTNVGSLVVVRNTARARELAVRAALGARRSRLIAQLAVESLVLAAIAAAAAWVIARWGVTILLSMLPVAEVPEQLEFHTDMRMLAFMGAVSLLSAALFTLAPAWRAATVALIPALAPSTATSRGARQLGLWFVAAQTAVSVVLLAAACLFLQSARNVARLGPGFDTDNVLQVELDRSWVATARGRTGSYTLDEYRAMYGAVEDQLRAVPGVRSVTAAAFSLLPMQFVGQPAPVDPAWVLAGPDFFETLGIPIVRGRALRREDALRTEGTAAVLSESLAAQLFHSEDGIGKIVPSIRLRNGIMRNVEVVGIAADARLNSLRWEPDPTLYSSALSVTRPVLALQIRTAIDPEQMIQPVRAAISRRDPRAIVSIRPMQDAVRRSIARERMVAATSGFFGLVGVVLAGVGLFGVAACAVARRTKELGVRLALGARASHVIREALRETAWVFGVGLALGGAAAFAAARSLGSVVSGLLFGLTATDWSNLAVATAMMVAAGVVACVMPAIRATRVDPLDALRHE